MADWTKDCNAVTALYRCASDKKLIMKFYGLSNEEMAPIVAHVSKNVDTSIGARSEYEDIIKKAHVRVISLDEFRTFADEPRVADNLKALEEVVKAVRHRAVVAYDLYTDTIIVYGPEPADNFGQLFNCNLSREGRIAIKSLQAIVLHELPCWKDYRDLISNDTAGYCEKWRREAAKRLIGNRNADMERIGAYADAIISAQRLLAQLFVPGYDGENIRNLQSIEQAYHVNPEFRTNHLSFMAALIGHMKEPKYINVASSIGRQNGSIAETIRSCGASRDDANKGFDFLKDRAIRYATIPDVVIAALREVL